jgi:hypothetical protein
MSMISLRYQIFPIVTRFLRPRYLSTTSPGVDTATAPPPPPPSPLAADKIKTLSASVRSSVAAGVNELQSLYGEAHAEKIWAGEYYRHMKHKYTVPALTLVSPDARTSSVLSTKQAVFFGLVFRGLPDASFQSYAAALSLADNVDIGLFLAAVRYADSPSSRLLFDRMGASVRRTGNRSLAELAQHVAAVPLSAPHAWPFPHLEPNAQAMTVSASMPAPGSPPLPWEVSALSLAARESSNAGEYLLISSTTVLESLWAEFYATGERAPLRRILRLAATWSEFAATPDAVSYLIAIDRPLPEGLAFEGGGKMEGDGALRAIRATLARAALWTLLHHSRRHARVTDAVAEACGAAGHFAAAPDAREVVKADAPWAQLTEEEARDGLAVWPALLHLIACSALETPFEGTPQNR